MLGFHLKQVIKFNLRNKSRLILAVLVIGIAISTLFTLNGILDIFSKNVTTSILDQLPEADFTITSNTDNYIYNYTTLQNSIESQDSLVKGATPRYSIDGGIFLNSSQVSQIIIPTQIIAINFTKEKELNLG